jgi:hypothetical protein
VHGANSAMDFSSGCMSGRFKRLVFKSVFHPC